MYFKIFVVFFLLSQFSDSDTVLCNSQLMYNGHCDISNRYDICYFDGFDCCLSSSGSLSSELCATLEGCHVAKLEDSQCQPDNNNVECLYDLGSCSVKQTLDKFGCMPILEADSICDLINNRAFCQFDGGDCSGDITNDTSM